MAGDKSKKQGRKTQTTKNKRKKTPAKVEKEKTATLPRLDAERGANGGMEKMPSNAPTMAIAPSDYEHIYHEGAAPTSPTQSPTRPADQDGRRGATRSPQQDFVNMGALPQSPQAAPLPTPLALPQAPPTQTGAGGFDVQVTPDGYTLLGTQPLEIGSSNARRVAFPSHVVRASNQFSRAALARVSKYLASRAEF